MVVKFRRYGVKPLDISHYVHDKQCNCRGPFHRCRNTDLLSTLRGCKCDYGRMAQMSEFCCDDPRIVDTNLLLDPGFETYAPDDVIPQHFISPVGEPWGQTTVFSQTPYFPLQFWVRDLDPDTGSVHAWQHFAAGAGGNGGQWIQPIRKRDCEFNFPYSAIVQPGDLVTWTLRAKVSQTAGTPRSLMMIDWFSTGWSDVFPNPGTTVTPLTTSYATYTKSAVAPAGAHFCRVFYQPGSTGAHSDTEWFMEGVELLVQ